MIQLKGKIKLLFSTKVIQICYNCHKLIMWKISKQRVHPYKNRILDCLIKLELIKTTISCCHLKLLPKACWSKMQCFHKLLDSQMTIVRFLISNQIVKRIPLAKCHTSLVEKDSILQLTISSKIFIMNKKIQSSSAPICRPTSLTCPTLRDVIKNCARIDKKCAKTKCLIRFRRSGMRWMLPTSKFTETQLKNLSRSSKPRTFQKFLHQHRMKWQEWASQPSLD